jgi:hypothetical protein
MNLFFLVKPRGLAGITYSVKSGCGAAPTMISKIWDSGEFIKRM